MADLNVDLNVEASLDDGQWFGRALALSAAPTGPVKLRARLQGRQGEYALNEIEASLGHSVLAGHAALAMTSDGLTWSLDLTSPSLELTDFQLTNLTAKGSAPAPAGDRATVVSGSFTLAADDVMAAGTSLGRLHTELRMGTSGITVDVFRLQSDHHGVEARCEQRVGAERIEVKADATISNFSYGVLSPLVPALSGREGRVYLDGELSAVGRPGESLLPRLKGNLGFAYFPEGIRSDLLDLWAVGLLRAVALPFTGGNRSQVQCIAGRFDVSDGVWKPRTFYLDTSRIRVRGTGTIDPVRDRIRFKLKPRPKRRAFIHLATPVVIRGKVSKPNVDISRSGLVVTAARLYFWAVTAIDSLLRREIPEHDFDGYMKMMKGEHP
jgi:hypothetical protein